MEQAQFSKRILLVDDDPTTNLINTKLITRYSNFLIQSYANAREALDYLHSIIHTSKENIPDIILLDINMPVMDGWEFLDELQKLKESPLGECIVFILSSSIDLEDVEKAKSYSLVRDFVSKPLTTEKIRQFVSGDLKEYL